MKIHFSCLLLSVTLPALSLAVVDQLRTPRRLTLTAGAQTNSQSLTYTGCNTSREKEAWAFAGPPLAFMEDVFQFSFLYSSTFSLPRAKTSDHMNSSVEKNTDTFPLT